MRKRIQVSLFIIIVMAATTCFAETYVPGPSNRVKINFGATPWKFLRSDPANAQNPGI